jgi:hypothetical protein
MVTGYRLLLLIIILILLGLPLCAQNPKQPLRAMAYSAILPGGGQIYNGSYLKSGIVIGIQTYLIGTAIYHADRKQHFHQQNDLVNEKLYRDELRNDYWWMGTTLVLSVADAFVDAHLYNFEQEKQKVHLKFEDKLLKLELKF